MNNSNTIFASVTYLVVIFSCTSPTTPKSDEDLMKRVETYPTPNDLSHDHDNLRIATDFAEKFSPAPTAERVVQNLANVPDSVITAFKYLRKRTIKNSEELLALIFLKLYRSHLECCHQSYELRTNIPSAGNIDSIADPLLFEFNLITKYFDNSHRIEFISSGIAHSWVESNRQLLENKMIKKEFDKIEMISKKIEKGVYWK